MKKFNDVITTREQLRSVIDEPWDMVIDKALDRLDKHCGVFINRCPFLLISSADAQGNADISPKGDPVGFVKIIDEKTLAIPDRPGNDRADTFENILQNPKVGLIFMIPGKSETLRVSGVASIVRDKHLRNSMAIRGRAPDFALVVHVEEAFFHCSKSIMRSKLWKQEEWPELSGLPRLADTMVDAGQLSISKEEMHEIVVNDEIDRLY